MGSGPTVVLVHGLGSRVQHWFPLARILAERHRLVFVELPGHGETPLPTPFSLDRATQALDGALAEIQGPVFLVGHSVGGLLATAEAIAHPERVRGLVLVETALRPQYDEMQVASMLETLDTDYQALIEAAYVSFGRDSLQGFSLYSEASQVGEDTMRPWIRLVLRADLSEDVRRLSVPVLAVLAERSWPRGESWEAAARTLGYEHIAELQHARISDSGHFLMLDHPEALAKAIERFTALPEGEPVALLGDPETARR
jgi:pimeloyl-ACP methyl ester carboxylesterase